MLYAKVKWFIVAIVVQHLHEMLRGCTFSSSRHTYYARFLGVGFGYRYLLAIKEWNSSHLKGFLNYECEEYLKQPFTPPHYRIVVAYYTSNHRLVIEIGRWLTILISKDNKLCHFFSQNVGIEAHFVVECPLYNFIRDRFSFMLQHVVLSSLKCFFQLDHQVDFNY